MIVVSDFRFDFIHNEDNRIKTNKQDNAILITTFSGRPSS